MRIFLVAGATLALAACGGGDTQANDANMAADNMTMDNLAMDPMMNGRIARGASEGQ